MLVAWSYPTLRDAIHSSPPGSSGILQARILERVAVPFSNCGEWGLLFVAAYRLIVVASLVAELGLYSTCYTVFVFLCITYFT